MDTINLSPTDPIAIETPRNNRKVSGVFYAVGERRITSDIASN